MTREERKSLLDLCDLLGATFHFEYLSRLEGLKDKYGTLDPDSDTQPIGSISLYSGDNPSGEFFEEFVELLERANFRRLDRAEFKATVGAVSDWGMNLDLDWSVFDRLEVFTRGELVTQLERRRPMNFYRREQIDIPVYQRLVVAFRFDETARSGDEDFVYLKLFKNIPKMELEMLLPGTKIRMTWFDRCKILLPTISGIIMTIMKIAKGALALAFAGVYGLLGLLGLVGGTIGYGIKSFFGYLRTKEKYQLDLTKNLYFKNLDNNAGVLFHLMNEVEEQEFREAILAYFLLWKHAPEVGWTEAELDLRAEAYLKTAADIDVDFEVNDALAKVQRLGLTRQLTSGRYVAVPIDEALATLDRAWDSFFPYNVSERSQKPATKRLAA